VQVYKTPLHVFAKSLDVLSKLSKLSQESGLDEIPAQSIPLKNITPSEVFVQVEKILEHVRHIQTAKKIGSSDQTIKFVSGLTPSNVYENLWKISFMLDSLVKKTTPTDVYNMLLKASANIVDVARQTNVSVNTALAKTDDRTKPSQVLLQGYLNLHQISRLETKLGLRPLRVPNYPQGKLTPSDVFDSASMLYAEIIRIKIHLKLNSKSLVPALQKNKKPSDVLALMLVVENNINALYQNK